MQGEDKEIMYNPVRTYRHNNDYISQHEESKHIDMDVKQMSNISTIPRNDIKIIPQEKIGTIRSGGFEKIERNSFKIIISNH